MLKFSLLGLLLIVLVEAVGCAAIAGNNELSRQTIMSLAIGLLIAANLAAIFRPSGRRAFAGGFALAGWIYFLLAFDAALGLREGLLTQRVAEWLGTTLHELPGPDPYAVMNVWGAGSGMRLAPTISPQHAAFYEIVHANCTLLVALAGGIAGRLFAGKPTVVTDRAQSRTG
jgi:hypothetical protein